MTRSALPSPPIRPLAIVSAMHQELAALLARGHQADFERQTHAGRDFWVGTLSGRSVVLVLCGIGKVAAAITATLLAERFGVGALVFTGVAGGLGADVKVGDLVLADDLLQHDMDASPLFPRFEVPLTGRSRFPADAALTQALAQACTAALARREPYGPAAAALGVTRPALHRGLIISGDRFVSAAAECQALCETLPEALAVEMEGAALAQACHDLGLPFAVLRIISDRADDSASVDFIRFIDEVAAQASAAIIEGWLSAG
ncbi:MAG: adenosylhomocysteine nucleosidase [Pseudomonadota bacterium]|nr:adenosylhomocysteine nucleosidase [Pseudomonadota bacterium]